MQGRFFVGFFSCTLENLCYNKSNITYEEGVYMDPVQIRTLGEFSLTAGTNRICETDSRSRKVWTMLAVLLCSWNQTISQQRMLELLWGENAGSNPENALRITLHRLRTLLDKLYPGAGRELVLRTEGGFAWNCAVPMELDSRRFEFLSQKAGNEDERLCALLEALSLYRGDFLPRFSSELWAVPITAHLHTRFLEVSQEAAELLSQRGRHGEAVQVCRTAIRTDPYRESLYQILIRELAIQGDLKGATQTYERLSKRLFEDFGIYPDDKTREIYRAAVHAPQDRVLHIEEILHHLQDPDRKVGAMRCDYDYFKVLCHAISRGMERTVGTPHIALISVTHSDQLSKRSLHWIMEALGEVMRLDLHRGDIFSQCSASQYIILLPKASHEIGDTVCRHLLAAFHTAHPHAAAEIHYIVRPLTQDIYVP